MWHDASIFTRLTAWAGRQFGVVDHGETYCKTPDAVLCIEKALKRKLCP